MEGLAILAVLALLSVPVMLIVALCKLGSLRDEIAELRREVREGRGEKTEPAPQGGHAARALGRGFAVASGDLPSASLRRIPPAWQERDKNGLGGVGGATPPPGEAACAVRDELLYGEESAGAVELMLGRAGDWLAVRGEFAPPGVTHEFAFATRWLVRVGLMLLVGSVVYFVKLSIDRGWMGPTGRVVATLLWGALLAGGGVFLAKRTRYGVIGHALAALGVVALYLGFGLGHRFFDPPVIASPVFAFAALAGVTVCAGVLAVFLPSPHIAAMGLVGGYLVPVLAGRDSGFPLGLDVYLLVLNLGAFFVARCRKWSALDFLAATLAWIVCVAWGGNHPHAGASAVLVNFAFLTLVHALYMTSVVLGSKFRGRAGNAIAWAGLALNACAYLAWLCTTFRTALSAEWAGLVFLALVAAYLAVAQTATRRGWADRQTVDILLVFAVAFLSVAPVLLFSRPWCVLCWAAIAVATAEAAHKTGQKLLGWLAQIVLVAAGVGWLYFAGQAYCAHGPHADGYLVRLVLRIVRLWTLPVAVALVGRRTRGPFFCVALGVAFLCLTGEARIFGHAFLPVLKGGAVTLAWLLTAVGCVVAGVMRRVKPVRVGGLVLTGVAVAKLLLVDTAGLPMPARVVLFAASGVLLMGSAFLYLKFKQRFEDA